MPGSIAGKYQSGYIESYIWDSWWLATTMKENWGEKVVRQSLVPSAMVDADGTLFTLHFHNSGSSYGIYFYLSKFTENNYSVSKSYKSVYPWTYFDTDLRSIVPSDTPITLNMGSRPDLTKDGNDPYYFKNYIHNAYQPCIAQDVGETASERLCLFFQIPNLRIAASRGDFDGILLLTHNKSTLEYDNVAAGRYSGYARQNMFSYNHQRPRRMGDSYDYNIELGNYTAWHYGEKVHLNWVAAETDNGWGSMNICCQYNDSWGHISAYDFFDSSNWKGCMGIAMYPRYIKFGDYIYGLWVYEGGQNIYLTQSGVSDEKFSNKQLWAVSFKHKHHSDGYSLYYYYNRFTLYQYDFCIVKAPDGTGIVCMLGIRLVMENDCDRTVLSSLQNPRWSSTHIPGRQNHYALMLSSFKIDTFNAGACYEDPQNMIYTTELTTGTACPTNCNCTRTAGEYGLTQLYKNTHKCCVYEAPSGKQYIIYCYCYPGKTKQLYLGYAPCWIDANYKVTLGPKCEFRETASQWSNSFGNFTSCARIISMDCKNGHLWITWMNADDTEYYYFHIKAKDLVGE